MAAITGTIFAILVGINGHAQGQHMVKSQPMKMAAAEALWESEDPASFSLFSISDVENRRNIFALRIPYLLSFLSYNRFNGEVKGINDLQAQFEAQHGPGNYIPPVIIPFWSFRIMVGVGTLMVILALFSLFLLRPGKFDKYPWALKVMTWALLLPYIANTAGWLLTEVGRFPWVVYELMRIENAVSPRVTAGMLWTSLIGYILVYGLLIAATVFLLLKYAKAGPSATDDLLLSEDQVDSMPSLVS
jgi:cytochrome d ubiquinol oxidase subunit I